MGWKVFITFLKLMLYLLISVACAGFVFEKQWGGELLRVHTPTYAPFWASFAKRSAYADLFFYVAMIDFYGRIYR